MVDRRSALLMYQCPSCKHIHKWSRAGAFCRTTCFYKWLGTDQSKFKTLKQTIYTSSVNAMEKLQENA